MTDEMLTWEERSVEASMWLVGEDPHMCCIDLYSIGNANGAFQLFARYAAPDDPVRHDSILRMYQTQRQQPKRRMSGSSRRNSGAFISITIAT